MNKTLKFEPEKWHQCKRFNWATCTEGINCYSYILNNPGYFWSVPGMGFLHMQGQLYGKRFNAFFQNMPIKEFRQILLDGAIQDGLIKVTSPKRREDYYPAVLFFAKDDKDFHWYRQDDNGFWSGKNGWRAAEDLDNFGVPITDPLLIRDERYPVFGSYFLVPRSGIKLRPLLDFI